MIFSRIDWNLSGSLVFIVGQIEKTKYSIKTLHNFLFFFFVGHNIFWIKMNLNWDSSFDKFAIQNNIWKSGGKQWHLLIFQRSTNNNGNDQRRWRTQGGTWINRTNLLSLQPLSAIIKFTFKLYKNTTILTKTSLTFFCLKKTERKKKSEKNLYLLKTPTMIAIDKWHCEDANSCDYRLWWHRMIDFYFFIFFFDSSRQDS